MKALVINNHTNKLTQPPGWDVDKYGECTTLHVRVVRDDNGSLLWTESAWEPSPQELQDLLAGGSLVLRCYGAQPAIALYVEPPLDMDDGLVAIGGAMGNPLSVNGGGG